MILRALLIARQATFNQIAEMIGQDKRIQCWHEIERLYNQKFVDRYADPIRHGEFVYFLTEKGRKKANETRLDKPTQNRMFE